MIFLIEYDRSRGRIVTKKAFKNSDRKTAYESRLQLELDLNLKDIENEVVCSKRRLRKPYGRPTAGTLKILPSLRQL